MSLPDLLESSDSSEDFGDELPASQIQRALSSQASIGHDRFHIQSSHDKRIAQLVASLSRPEIALDDESDPFGDQTSTGLTGFDVPSSADFNSDPFYTDHAFGGDGSVTRLMGADVESLSGSGESEFSDREELEEIQLEMIDPETVKQYEQSVQQLAIYGGFVDDLAAWVRKLAEYKSFAARNIELEIRYLSRMRFLHYLVYFFFFSIIVFFTWYFWDSVRPFLQGAFWYVALPAQAVDVLLPFIVMMFPWPFEVSRRPPVEERKRMCVVIPTMGQSNTSRREGHYKKVQKTLRSVVRYLGHDVVGDYQDEKNFPAIVVVDNAINPKSRFQIPDPFLEREIKKVHPKILYVWVPFASKTRAISYVTYHLLLRGNEAWRDNELSFAEWESVAKMDIALDVPKYTIILDDDTLIPYDMPIPAKLYLHECTGCLYPIQSFHHQRQSNWLCKMQDIEYKKAGAHRLFQSQTGFCLAPHGAISIWKTLDMMRVLFHHDSKFQGEDLQMGLIVYEEKLGKNRVFLGCGATIVKTDACATFKSLWGQRVRSWEPVPARMFIRFLLDLIRHWSFNRIALKLYIFQELWTIFADVLRLFFITYGLVTYPFMLIISMAVLLVLQYFQLLILNYYKLPPQYQVSHGSLLQYMLYAVLLLVFRVSGFAYNIFVFDNRQRVSRPGSQLLAQNELPYVRGLCRLAWLFSDNETGSGWQYMWRLDEHKIKSHCIHYLKQLAAEGNLMDRKRKWTQAEILEEELLDIRNIPTTQYDYEGETDDDPFAEDEIAHREQNVQRRFATRHLSVVSSL